MDKFIVTITGLLTITGIYWFFFGKKEENMKTSTTWNITVEGGYQPATVVIPKNKESLITFIRKDSNPCLEEIVLPDFKIKKFLPLNTPVTLTLTPTKPGEFGMHCGMNMFHGRIVVI